MDSFLFKSSRIGFRKARPDHINYIGLLENKEKNLGLVLSQDFDSHLEQIENHLYLVLILESLASGDNIGFIISKLDKDSRVLEFRRFVIDHKGKGFGKEAIRAFMDFAFKYLTINRFWLDVYSHNTRAIKLYQGLNMNLDAILRQSYYFKGDYLDQLIFSILKSEHKTLAFKS